MKTKMKPKVRAIPKIDPKDISAAAKAEIFKKANHILGGKK